MRAVLPRLIVRLTLFASVICLTAGADAQSAAIPPTPPPDLTTAVATTPAPDLTPTVTIGFANSPSVRTHGHGRHFGLLAIRPHETVNIQVQFAVEAAGASLLVHALDGGEARTPQAPTVAADGTASFQFQAGAQPGLYRIVISGVGDSLLQFWVPDPKNPNGDPPVLNPKH